MPHRPSLLTVLLLVLGLGGPARALTISTDVTLPDDSPDGAIHDSVTLTGSAVLTINPGGWVDGELEADDSSTVNLSGGKVNGPFEAHDSSTVNLSSGEVVTSLVADGNSTVNVSGGSIDQYLQSFDSSSMTVSGGSIGSNFIVLDSSTATVSHGTIGGFVYVSDDATASFSGGTFSGNFRVLLGSKVTLTGGTIGGSLEAQTTAQLDIFGCHLALTSTHISGTLLDGSALDNPVVNASGIVLHDDLELPTITCPGDITVAATSTAGATVSFPAPLAFDNRPGVTVVCKVGGQVVSSPHLFAVGMTPVLCTATDACGNTSPCGFNVTVLPIADLQISQTADQSTVKSGRNLTYTLLVKNTGPFTASGVIVNDPVPSGSTFVSAPGAAGPPPAGYAGTVSWNVGTLTSGQSVALTLTVKVTQKGNSTMSNTASANGSAGTPDPNPANNAATLQTKVIGNSK